MHNFTSPMIINYIHITVVDRLKNSVLCCKCCSFFDSNSLAMIEVENTEWIIHKQHWRRSGITAAAFSCISSTFGSTTVRLVTTWRRCLFCCDFLTMSNSTESQPLGRKGDFVEYAKGPRRLAQASLICYRATLPPCQERCQAKDKVCVCLCDRESKPTKTLYLVLVSKDTVSLMKRQYKAERYFTSENETKVWGFIHEDGGHVKFTYICVVHLFLELLDLCCFEWKKNRP